MVIVIHMKSTSLPDENESKNIAAYESKNISSSFLSGAKIFLNVFSLKSQILGNFGERVGGDDGYGSL